MKRRYLSLYVQFNTKDPTQTHSKDGTFITVVVICVNLLQDKPTTTTEDESDVLTSGLQRTWHPRQRHLANILDRQLKHIRLHNQEHRDTTEFECVISKTSPTFPICLYDLDKDIFISNALKTDGIWEPFITRIYQTILNKYPEAWVIDVGANIGYYTLLSARMGHNVISIEPVQDNYERLHRSIEMGKVRERVYLVTNALSDQHRNISLDKNSNNQGGIRVEEADSQAIGGRKWNSSGLVPTATLNDLLQIVQTPQAVIKLDIEGYECRVMKTANKFLKNVFVPYILMEWKQMFIHQRSLHTSCTTQDLLQLCNYLPELGYEPYEVQTHIKLNPARCTTIWRIGDIYWKHRTAKSIHPG